MKSILTTLAVAAILLPSGANTLPPVTEGGGFHDAPAA